MYTINNKRWFSNNADRRNNNNSPQNNKNYRSSYHHQNNNNNSHHHRDSRDNNRDNNRGNTNNHREHNNQREHRDNSHTQNNSNNSRDTGNNYRTTHVNNNQYHSNINNNGNNSNNHKQMGQNHHYNNSGNRHSHNVQQQQATNHRNNYHKTNKTHNHHKTTIQNNQTKSHQIYSHGSSSHRSGSTSQRSSVSNDSSNQAINLSSVSHMNVNERPMNGDLNTKSETKNLVEMFTDRPMNYTTVPYALPTAVPYEKPFTSWLDMFLNEKFVLQLFTYLDLKDSLKYFCIVKKVYALKQKIPIIRNITLLFEDKEMLLNINNYWIGLSKSRSLVSIFSQLSPKLLKYVKFEFNEDPGMEINSKFLLSYFRNAEYIEEITVEGSTIDDDTVAENCEENIKDILKSLRFGKLTIKNNPFQLEHSFLKKIRIKEIVFDTPNIHLPLELMSALPDKLRGITLCRPKFTIPRFISQLPKTNKKCIYRIPIKKIRSSK
eukprot:UN30988